MKLVWNRNFVVLAMSVLLAQNSSFAQKGGGGQTGGAGGSQQSPGSPSGAPAGITGGSSPIESTLFSYAALNADAGAISAGVIQSVGKQPTIVITTASDLSAFVQWRVILGQGAILLGRLRTAQADLSGVSTIAPIAGSCFPPGAADAAPAVKVGSSFIGGVSDIQTALQTIASVTAVNQTLVSSQGNMTDLPLLNLVGDLLQQKSTVYVPSLLTPSALDHTDLGNGPLGYLLWQLEDERMKARRLLNGATGLLTDWQIAATNKGNTCTSARAAQAASLISRWTAPAQALNTTLASVDAFESSLFSGQGQSQNATPAGQNGNQSQQTASPGATPVPPIAAGNSNQPQSPAPSPQPSALAGNTLQQIFAVDLLYQQLPTAGQQDGGSFKDVHFLEVHALESGGGLLTKSNMFLGSRLYFSGGAVATFTLFDHSGKVECGGVAYAYQGYVKPEKVADALAGAGPRTVLNSTCGPQVLQSPTNIKHSN